MARRRPVPRPRKRPEIRIRFNEGEQGLVDELAAFAYRQGYVTVGGFARAIVLQHYWRQVPPNAVTRTTETTAP